MNGIATSTEVSDDELLALAQTLSQQLMARGWMLASAESCTGGLIAATCTELSGSSLWFERGFVTYSNAAKSELLRVSGELIATHGAVSEPVATAMARGACAHSAAQVSVAVTGVAGPTGGSPNKPVGTVWFGWSLPGRQHVEVCHFTGDRRAVRRQTVRHALGWLVTTLGQSASPT
ncbi:CinA family protein [Sphaerotilus mobilis]|uniref:Nicotinamide-nucleotide amidase n=1 Tax=Sphaerotilus mobilis TaxID=47994 RepID=A0A4Q7LKD9_9BURK|nr:CinA family protein [Sphaerotilus mobilis]RZS54622.1 nicotinamide-nucleotide amidase [Sphaerotilus mobilis]